MAAAVLLAFGAGLAVNESERAATEARVALERAERGAKKAAERASRPRRTRTYRDGVLLSEEVLPPINPLRQEN